MFDSIVCGVILSVWGRLLFSCMKAANQGLKDLHGQHHVKPWKRGLCFFGWVGTYPRSMLLTALGSEGCGSRLVSVVPGVWCLVGYQIET